uniref:Major sperm protein n=1 Tax=Panagrellus redivivus TaxID=6233 RepID=A0A7E4UUZ4_PANRE
MSTTVPLKWLPTDVCARKGEPCKWYQNTFTLRFFHITETMDMHRRTADEVIITNSDEGYPAHKLLIPLKDDPTQQYEYIFGVTPRSNLVNKPSIVYNCAANEDCTAGVTVDADPLENKYMEYGEHFDNCATQLLPDVPSQTVRFFNGAPHIPVPQERVAAFGKAKRQIYLRPLSQHQTEPAMYHKFIDYKKPLFDHTEYNCEKCNSTVAVFAKEDHTIELFEQYIHKNDCAIILPAELQPTELTNGVSK